MGGNLLMILGRIKTTKKKFTSSQILFSTLFVSDLTFGVVQIPSKIYLLWKSSEPTCFEVQLSSFSMSFPICISFNLLCIISIERYVYVVYNGFYTRIVTKKGGPQLYSPLLSTGLYLKLYFLLRVNVTHILAFPIPAFTSVLLLMFHSLYLHLCLPSVYTF